MSTKHTSEPFTYKLQSNGDLYEDGLGVFRFSGVSIQSDVRYRHSAESLAARIVQCVNALQGIPDPAAALQQAREALAKLQSVGCDVCPGCGSDIGEDEGHEDDCFLHNALIALGGTP